MVQKCIPQFKKMSKIYPKRIRELISFYWSVCTSICLSSLYHFKFFLHFSIVLKTRVKCNKLLAAMYACIIGLSSASLYWILFACCCFWGCAGQDAPKSWAPVIILEWGLLGNTYYCAQLLHFILNEHVSTFKSGGWGETTLPWQYSFTKL